jgi:NAD(P)-dependent dehydrogenase (short-subunit alcohol dehydrogenase family)
MVDFALRQDCLFLVSDASRNTHYYLFQIHRPPLFPRRFRKRMWKHFGPDVPLGRPGQPEEIAPSYVFLASDDSSYLTGQILHPNGGTIVNG